MFALKVRERGTDFNADQLTYKYIWYMSTVDKLTKQQANHSATRI